MLSPQKIPVRDAHAGNQTKRSDGRYYASLSDIKLPPTTRFVAGFVHKKRSFADSQQILNSIENAFEFPVDVACSCGLGHRTPQTASKLMAQLIES